MNYEEIAKELIPGGASTRSKFSTLLPDYYPKVITSGYGPHFEDDSGRTFLDLTSGLGSCILGYEIGFGGDNYSLTSIDEVRLAKKLTEVIPCAEQVRFFKTGSEATTAAIRLARYLTGKRNIICCGYHGWHDWYANCLPDPLNRATTYDYISKVPYNINEITKALCPNTAAVIIEPFNREVGIFDIYLLRKLKRLCEANNCLLIYDEIFSGFRFDFNGLQSRLFDFLPDMACFSKAMGNGAPIAALVGRKEYMQRIEDLHISGTFCGETYGIKKALETIRRLEEESIIPQLNDISYWFNLEIANMLLRYDFVKYNYYYSWGRFEWKDKEKENIFLKKLIDNDIFYHKNHILNYSHTQELLGIVLEIYRDIFKYINGKK